MEIRKEKKERQKKNTRVALTTLTCPLYNTSPQSTSLLNSELNDFHGGHITTDKASTSESSREPSEPGQDPTFEGGSGAGAALVIPTNPSTPGGAAPTRNKGLVNQQHTGGQIQVGKAQAPHLDSYCSHLLSPGPILSGGLRAEGTCNAACRASYCFAPHAKQPQCLSKTFLQAVSSLPPTTANGFNAALKHLGCTLGHTHKPSIPLFPDDLPKYIQVTLGLFFIVLAYPCFSALQAAARAEPGLSQHWSNRWWSRECWGTSHKSPVDPQNPHAHIEIASISLNSPSAEISLSPSGHEGHSCPSQFSFPAAGAVFCTRTCKYGSTTTQIKAHLLHWDLDPSLNTSTCYQSVTQKTHETSIHCFLS